MTLEELNSGLTAITEKAEKDKRLLVVQWARENRRFRDGDTATDHIGSGVVLRMKITYSIHTPDPSIYYECHELKKDGTLKYDRKGNKSIRYIYENNIKP